MPIKKSSFNLNTILPEVAMGKTAVFAIMAFSVAFLFTGCASAQDFSRFSVPHAVCQEYRSQAGYSIERDLTNECVVRSGNNQIGFVYIRAYNSNGNFCVTMTSSTLGQIMAPQCSPIPGYTQQQQGQQNTSPKIVTPPSFRIRDLQYDTLPPGKLIESGDNERIELTMPDGSKIQIDANSTFTPVSDHEVQSVFGRYRYLWTPFHNGKCIVGQNLVREECRKVKTRDAILGSRGTEFLVETDKSGTSVTVIEGSLGVTDLNGKKTVEVAGGQSIYIKHGGLPADPETFDPAKIERWWEKKTPEQTTQGIMNIIIGGGVILFIVMLFVKRKQIFRSRKNEKPTLAAADDTKSAPIRPKPKRAKIILLILIIIILGIVVLYALGQT